MPDTTSVHDALNHDEWNLEEIQRILRRDSSSINELKERRTPLHRVLTDERCSVALVKLLLSYGADTNHSSFECSTSVTCYLLHCRGNSSVTLNTGIIRALVEAGAKADHTNNCCLSYALEMNADLEIIKLLLIAGADLLKHNHSNECPIFQALKHFNVSAFRSLLDLQNVNVNFVRNNCNDSLLHSALKTDGCTSAFVEFLIDRGIRVDSFNKIGNTPLHIAVEMSPCQLDVVDLLLRKGSLVSDQNKCGVTPLNLAMTSHCHSDVVQLLLKYFLLQNPYCDEEDWIHERQGVFLEYANDCKSELRRMNSEDVGNGRTLFEFLLTYSRSQMNKNGEYGFDADHILQIISNENYPIYSNVISSKCESSLLNDKLEECNKCTEEENRPIVREISFNFVRVFWRTIWKKLIG